MCRRLLVVRRGNEVRKCDTQLRNTRQPVYLVCRFMVAGQALLTTQRVEREVAIGLAWRQSRGSLAAKWDGASGQQKETACWTPHTSQNPDVYNNTSGRGRLIDRPLVQVSEKLRSRTAVCPR